MRKRVKRYYHWSHTTWRPSTIFTGIRNSTVGSNIVTSGSRCSASKSTMTRRASRRTSASRTLSAWKTLMCRTFWIYTPWAIMRYSAWRMCLRTGNLFEYDQFNTIKINNLSFEQRFHRRHSRSRLGRLRIRSVGRNLRKVQNLHGNCGRPLSEHETVAEHGHHHVRELQQSSSAQGVTVDIGPRDWS